MRKKRKWYIGIIILATIIFFVIINIITLDGKCYFRLCSNVFLNNCSNEDAHKLDTMPFIHRLEIRNCVSDSIYFVEDKIFLTELSIMKYNGDWSPIKKCKQLRSFSTTNCSFDDLTFFSEMTHLEKLDFAEFSYDVQINSINGIENLKSLKYLNLNGLKEKDMNSINILSNLEFLGLSNSDILYINISLEKIKCLNLSHNYKLKNCTFKDECINLQSVIISDCPEINVDVNELINLPNLKEVKVTKEVFTNEEIEKLTYNGIRVIVS